MPLLAVTALVQRLARGVQAQHASAPRQVRHDDDLRLVRIDRRNRATGAAEYVANGFPHLRDDLLRRHAAAFRLGTEALDEEAMPCIEQLGPVDAPGLRVEHFGRLRRHLLDDAQDPARGSQLQVQLVEERLVRFELDGAESRRQVGCTKRLQFVNQGGLGFLGAGGDQAQWDAGRHDD